MRIGDAMTPHVHKAPDSSHSMKPGFRKAILRLHFIALTAAVANALFKAFTTYSLGRNIEFGVEMLTAISGLTLFVMFLNPFKKINLYFSVYAIAALLLMAGLLIRGMFWGVVLSVLLFLVLPDDTEIESDGIVISTAFQGLMASCCTYQVKERKLLLFEKDHGTWDMQAEGPVDFKHVTIHSAEDEIKITYSTHSAPGVIQTKTFKKQ
ncbi:MAG: hypothetical protein ACK5XV_11055 [Flavobacteriales bacterium]|jgi:hypothetical protein